MKSRTRLLLMLAALVSMCICATVNVCFAAYMYYRDEAARTKIERQHQMQHPSLRDKKD